MKDPMAKMSDHYWKKHDMDTDEFCKAIKSTELYVLCTR